MEKKKINTNESLLRRQLENNDEQKENDEESLLRCQLENIHISNNNEYEDNHEEDINNEEKKTYDHGIPKIIIPRFDDTIVPLVITENTPPFRIKNVNSKWEDLIGYKKEELEGKSIYDYRVFIIKGFYPNVYDKNVCKDLIVNRGSKGFFIHKFIIEKYEGETALGKTDSFQPINKEQVKQIYDQYHSDINFKTRPKIKKEIESF